MFLQSSLLGPSEHMQRFFIGAVDASLPIVTQIPSHAEAEEQGDRLQSTK